MVGTEQSESHKSLKKSTMWWGSKLPLSELPV